MLQVGPTFKGKNRSMIFSFILATTMANTVKFFMFIRESYAMVGIFPNHLQQTCSYNWRNFTALLFMSMMFVASTSFLLFQANSFQEFASAFYISITLLVNIVSFPTIIPNAADIFVLMEKFREFVEKRKCRENLVAKYC